ncbi:hypothetical protein RS86_02690 [Microbacterium azadirachtae]|uniref:Uncharacterized protein n=1 Tax=Microbacterium azadirachtae TaxID=582680 RepID=A0A0F0LGG8_9MICO|nr:hypothetical protein RS86_02690 [Microbacterium azadirachtae]
MFREYPEGLEVDKIIDVKRCCQQTVEDLVPVLKCRVQLLDFRLTRFDMRERGFALKTLTVLL